MRAHRRFWQREILAVFYLSSVDNSIRSWLQDMAEQIQIVKQSDLTVVNRSWKHLEMFKHHTRILSDTLLRSAPVNPDSVWIVMRHGSDTTVNVMEVPHLMETKWGQDELWNLSLLPFSTSSKYYVTGCVPTAVAQSLYYYHHYLGCPSGLYHSVSILSMNPHIEWFFDHNTMQYISQNYGDTTSISRLDYQSASSRWDLMPLDSLSAIANLSGAGYVSDLMIDIGNRLNAHYSDNMTSVYFLPNTIETDFSRCNIDYQFSLYNSAIRDTVFSNLLNSRPVMVQAAPPWTNSGHLWVIDGCYHKETTVRNTYSYHYISYEDFRLGHIPSLGVLEDWFISLQDLRRFYPNAPRRFDQIITTDHERFFRMNWGYNGRYDDGYYACGINDNWESNVTYSNNKAVYYNLFPSTSFVYKP